MSGYSLFEKPDENLEDRGCLFADNNDKGKWSLAGCGERKPFVCMFVQDEDPVFECAYYKLEP